jgi:hypothetical protein
VTDFEVWSTEMRSRTGFAISQLTELQDTRADTWAKQSFEIATTIAFQNDGLTGSPRSWNKSCTTATGAPVLPVGDAVNARRIAE